MFQKLNLQLNKSNLNKHIFFALTLQIFLLLILNNRYDYLEYEKQWQFVLDGGIPWDFGSNAYGPFHAVMAFFYDLHPKLPRIIFSLASIAASLFLITKLRDSPIIPKYKHRLYFLLLYNPIIWIMFVINGCNDGLVGCLFIFGVILYDKRRFISSALLLAIAIVYKFIPLFILPVLCLNNRKINWQFTFSIIFFLFLGFGGSYYLWGEKMLNPIIYNSGREAKILSIFRYLDGHYSFLNLFEIGSINFLSIYFVVGSVLGIFLAQLLFQWHWIKSLIATLLCVHIFYLVGHFQFHISIYFLMIYFWYKFGNEENTNQFHLIHFCLCWIAGTTLLYGVTEGFYRHFAIIREFIGLPHFIILSMTLISIISFNSKVVKQ